jgi:7-cyano-7-deazaguanine synthase
MPVTIQPRNAVVLLSGGVDSSTCLAIAKSQGFRLYALSFDYGQRHIAELESARRIASAIGVEQHLVLKIDLRAIGGSALTSDAIAVPKDRPSDQMADDIPVSYVPARNTILLAFALGWSEVVGAFDIFIGANAQDYSGYPDCRPEFIAAFEQMANLSTKAGVSGAGKFTIHAPLMHLSKAEIVTAGARLGLDYGQTLSCYDASADGRACGRCDSCILRQKGFREAHLPDPTRYQ